VQLQPGRRWASYSRGNSVLDKAGSPGNVLIFIRPLRSSARTLIERIQCLPGFRITHIVRGQVQKKEQKGPAGLYKVAPAFFNY
jgi:hypothetical protein